jgi:hypothetical protein
VNDVTDKNFGLIIAFLLPGFLCLWGLSLSFDELRPLLGTFSSEEAPTFGGFLYSSLMSLSIGLLVSAVRWLIVDRIMHHTGVPEPRLNFAETSNSDKCSAFLGLVENHYRYYQYYANSLVAVVTSFAVYTLRSPDSPSWRLWMLVLVVSIALFCGSRDALAKYYKRSVQVLGELTS